MYGKRKLSFEQLESKRSPTSLLLAMAPAAEESQRAFEEAAAECLVASEAADHWRFHHDTEKLLTFVEQETRPTPEDQPHPRPTEEACQMSDEMMKLDHPDLRCLVVTTY